MSENTAIKIIENYYSNHGFHPERLYPENFPSNTKVPDFVIKESGEISHYCELKSPDLILNPKTNLFHWQTTVSKLRDMMHKAVKQFKGVDPEHKYPWVLAITSSHMQLNWTNMVHTINGVAGFNNTVFSDFRDKRFISDTQDDLVQIDFIFWNQVNYQDKRIFQYVPFINVESLHVKKVEVVSKLLKPTSLEKIVDRNSRRF